MRSLPNSLPPRVIDEPPIVTNLLESLVVRGTSGGPTVGELRADTMDGGSDTIEIGLLNNMPDAALQATERQFATLIGAAAGRRRVRLRYFFLPDLQRGEVARSYLRSRYADLGSLWKTGLDALIVTGQEPRASRLTEEPFWRSLTNVIDWAQTNTITTIWSCLAAHTAVLHLDRIDRRPLPTKLSGVFNCDKAEDSLLLRGIAGPLAIPHSRYNGLREEELVTNGYRILTRSAPTGPDMFIKKGRSLFVFMQGHPEYDAHSLFLEYRRDIGRFLRGEMEFYPDLPQNYFDDETARSFREFEKLVRACRHPNMLAKYPDMNAPLTPPDRSQEGAVKIFGNWLDYVVSQKARRLRCIF